MKKNKRKEVEIFNLSFLDVISCGFGAIILLLVISKISQPLVVAENTLELNNELSELQAQLIKTQQKIQMAQSRLDSSQEKLSQLSVRLKKSKRLMSTINGEVKDSRQNLQTQKIIKQKMAQAKQKLTEQMRRLQKNKVVINKQNTIGGISVNSDYIIFIIDTSGSMHNFAWSMVRKKMQEILAIHPDVKGIQVLNDMGKYMFSQYAGRWISDTPARRRAILKRLNSWEPFSNSSPKEGIRTAIRQFYAADKQISIFILGDDFSSGSIQSVINTVDKLNHSNRSGIKRVRINAVGFPVLFNHPGGEMNLARFAALMRKLAENNNGSFVGLTQLK